MQTQPHKEYEELIELLLNKGMIINDQKRVYRKLSQVGYYRLSSFWYVFQDKESRSTFQKNTSFDDVYSIYLFDKKLRLLMMDMLERFEVCLRSFIAHELGREDPLAYLKKDFINPKHLKSTSKEKRPIFDEWLIKLDLAIDRNKREQIISQYSNPKRGIPFWAIVEVWDFGTTAKFFGMLKGSHQRKIIERFDITKAGDEVVFSGWLNTLNILRNRCAHHSRIWNQKTGTKNIKVVAHSFFDMYEIKQDRLVYLVIVLWFLMKNICPNSNFLQKLNLLIDELPDNLKQFCLTGMGFDSKLHDQLINLCQ